MWVTALVLALVILIASMPAPAESPHVLRYGTHYGTLTHKDLKVGP